MAIKLKTLRVTLWVATVILILLTVACVFILIFSPKSLLETTVEVVSLVTGAMALTIAIISQVAANREENRLRSIIADLHNIIRNDRKELKVDETIQEKLDEILEIERGQGK